MGTIKGAYTARTVSKMSFEEVANLLNEQQTEIKIQRMAIERYREAEMRCEQIKNGRDAKLLKLKIIYKPIKIAKIELY